MDNRQGNQYQSDPQNNQENPNSQYNRGRNRRNNEFDQAMLALGDLLSSITDEVHDSLRGVGAELRDSFASAARDVRGQRSRPPKQRPARPARSPEEISSRERKLIRKRQKRIQNKRGWMHFLSVSGILASTGLGIATGIILITMLFDGYYFSITPLFILLFLFISCTVCTKVFTKSYRRLRRLGQYLNIVGLRSRVSIAELAAGTAQTEAQVIKDLQEFLQRGDFPFAAFLSRDHSHLFLDPEAFHSHMDQTVSYQPEPEPREEPVQEEAPPQSEPKAETQEENKDDFLTVGYRYLDELNQFSRTITNPEIVQNTQKICQVSAKILNHVTEHPEKREQIRKFLGYYLPTTVKLLRTYSSYDEAGLSGGNVSTIKKNINSILATIYGAFENLLDSLFQEEALDISTDITVLKGLLEQEGLSSDGTSSPFGI